MKGYPPDYEVEGQRSLFDDNEQNTKDAKDRDKTGYCIFVQDDAFDYPVMTKKGKGNGE